MVMCFYLSAYKQDRAQSSLLQVYGAHCSVSDMADNDIAIGTFNAPSPLQN